MPSFVATSQRRVQFLRHLYWGDAVAIDSVEEAGDIIKLADFFVAAAVVRRVEGWLCGKALFLLSLGDKDSVDQLCTAFELATQHRLTLLTSMLLPWAMQRLNNGPLADPAWAVWNDSAQRLSRLQAAMDPDLKAFCMEVQWWSCGMPQRCDQCGCRSGDLAICLNPPAMRPASGSAPPPRARSRLPDYYLAASAHLAHLLSERQWGCTSSVSEGIQVHAGPAHLTPPPM